MKIVKKIGKSFLKFVLLTAIVHIGILVFITIKEGNIKILNYFSILSLNQFWPKIVDGWKSDLLSLIIMVSIISVFFMLNLNKNNKD